MKIQRCIFVTADHFVSDKTFDFLALIKKYKSKIVWRKGDTVVNGKSVLSSVVFFLTLKEGDKFSLEVEGIDALDMIKEITHFILSQTSNVVGYWEQVALEEMKKALIDCGSKQSLQRVVRSYSQIS